ncbi:hypothetical protein ILUMI_16126 [Ignelater luminosus]|uniref:DDE-1 domain-containing protein n=1 Tax=Ignelater luminosus TaxID=2038154 RepID=A0A8K0CTH9_IGNLU|nr:hypothetical protein ILUMI_16126 [Ignelater luminosus]
MLKGAPPGAMGLAPSIGWINSKAFEKVLKHFIRHCNNTKDNPSLLIYDNHERHISINVINKAGKAGKKEDNYDSSSEDENIAYKELSETVTCEPEEIDYDTIFEEKFAIVKLRGEVFT